MFYVLLIGGILLTGLLGIPIGVGLGLTGLAILHFLGSGSESLAITTVWNVFNDFVLSAIPMFIFMGEIMLASGVSKKLYAAVTPLFRPIPGGLLHTNIAVCTLFGAVSGASTSTAAAVGAVAYPELKQRGYSRSLTVATLAAGGTLGLLIPPSLSLLIYGAMQGVSIGQLFIAGIVPGILLSIAFMVLTLFMARRDPTLAPVEKIRTPLPQIIIGLLRTWPMGLLVFAVLGTIYMGIATPTEAASLGVVAAIIVGFTWGELTVGAVLRAFRNGVYVFGTLGVVLAGALILSQAISVLGIPAQAMATISELQMSRYWVLALVVLIYLILGCFFDGTSMMLMTLPVVYPVMTQLGFDPIWLGVIITLMVEIGMLTPPVGLNLFVLVAITRGEVSLGQAAAATIPFWLVMLGSVAVFTAFPWLVTGLGKL